MLVSEPTRLDGDTLVTVALTADQAPHVAKTLFSFLSGEAGLEIDCREEIADVRAALDLYSGWLDQIGWGEPAGDVTLTLPRAQMSILVEYLTELDGAGGGIDEGREDYLDKLEYVRGQIIGAEAGLAILDQLAPAGSEA